MIILAIDSGIEKTGFSLFQQEFKSFKYLNSGLIHTDKKKNLEVRIHKIFTVLNDVIIKYKPDKIILEQLFFFKNQKTVISVSQTQGVILLLTAQHKISIDFLTPLQIKQTITGYGQADKLSVRKMIGMTIKIKKEIKEDDEIDAIACGLAYCYLHNY